MDINKLNKSNKTKIIVISLLAFLLAAIGITYAYFGIRITGNETASSARLTTANLSLVYNDIEIISHENMLPGWSDTKTLTVYNDGNRDVYYNIIWSELLNEFINDEIVLTFSCASSVNGNTCPSFERAVPTRTTLTNNVSIKKNIPIEVGETHTYTVTITFIETSSLQNYNKRKEIRGKINISEGAEYHPLYNVVKSLAEEGTYASTYSGNDTNDTYGEDATKPIYYVRTKTANNTTQAATILNSNTDIISGSGIRGINVKFAGFCWQILRTTDTGGIKLIYNGEYVSGTGCKAQNTTDTHKGIIGTSGGSESMMGNYMYSDTFTYDITAGTFTLVNPIVSNWSTNKDLLGKYTCKTNSSTSTCATLYYLNTSDRTTANNACYATYTIGDTQNAQIGTSRFNANYKSPAYVGYKFGKAYDYVANSAPTSGVIMGNDVYWNGSNYVLKDGDNNSTYTYSGTQNANYHYTCNTTSATCTDGKVRYYYYGNYYIELLNGDTVETALARMLESNTYDSAMKSYLENWYYNNLRSYEDYIDQDAVYCNDRSITSLGGWSKTGSLATGAVNYLQFKNYDTITTLGCVNNLDKFSVSNPNAELKYPIGLATAPEMNLINNTNIRTTRQYNRLVSASYFSSNNTGGRSVTSSGSVSLSSVSSDDGARPVITLSPSNRPITGDGSLSNPYVIE